MFRVAQEGDLDRLVEIHLSAFPDERGHESRRRNFLHNPLGGLDALWVALRKGVVVGHAFLFPLEAWFGGVRVAVGGIASVGVAPEARGEGVASSLLSRLHDHALARGDALTLLYPFRQGFYVRSEYVPVTPSLRLALRPEAIPRPWRDTARDDVRAARGADREAIERLYEVEARRRTGWLVRTPAQWERRLSREQTHWFVVERQGGIVGYSAWTLEQPEVHASTTLVVSELVAQDDMARRRLLCLVAAQRDQVAEVWLDVDGRDPIDRVLVDIDGGRAGTEALEHRLGAVVGGPMVRVLDAPRALSARGYRADGDLDVGVDDDASVHLTIREGRGSVGPARGGPQIRVGRRALAAILFGGLSPSDAARLGWLTADDDATLRRADELLELPPFFAIDPF